MTEADRTRLEALRDVEPDNAELQAIVTSLISTGQTLDFARAEIAQAIARGRAKSRAAASKPTGADNVFYAPPISREQITETEEQMQEDIDRINRELRRMGERPIPNVREEK